MNRSFGRVAAVFTASVALVSAAPQTQPPSFQTGTRTVAVYATVTNPRGRLVPDLADLPANKRWRSRRIGMDGVGIGDAGPCGRILVRGEPGWQIIEELAPLPGEIVIDKPGKGMFWATGLHEMLQGLGVTHLVFTGVTTEVCVQTSMREANDRGYDCLIVEDATESYFPEFKAAALAMIAAQGAIVGWHTPSATLLAALDAT